MDRSTARLRKELVRNKKLATEISKVLARYELKVPEGKTVVWGPIVVDDAVTMWDAYGILVNGIPNPMLLDAAYRFEEKFGL